MELLWKVLVVNTFSKRCGSEDVSSSDHHCGLPGNNSCRGDLCRHTLRWPLLPFQGRSPWRPGLLSKTIGCENSAADHSKYVQRGLRFWFGWRFGTKCVYCRYRSCLPIVVRCQVCHREKMVCRKNRQPWWKKMNIWFFGVMFYVKLILLLCWFSVSCVIDYKVEIVIRL